jgi:hypothetical protein
MAITDTHGDMVDAASAAVVRAFMADWKPTIRVHMGDVWDFRWLRHGASDDERRESVEADFEAGLDLLAWYKPTHILWGNHDDRLRRGSECGTGYMRELCGQWIDRIAVQTAKAQHFPYCKRRGVMELGDYRLIHGYGHGLGAVSQAARVYGRVMMGHVHTIEQAAVPGIEDRIGHTIGCLCRLDLEYNRTHINTLRQAHGFAYGIIDNGRTLVWQARSIGGRWHLPSEMTV